MLRRALVILLSFATLGMPCINIRPRNATAFSIGLYQMPCTSTQIEATDIAKSQFSTLLRDVSRRSDRKSLKKNAAALQAAAAEDVMRIMDDACGSGSCDLETARDIMARHFERQLGRSWEDIGQTSDGVERARWVGAVALFGLGTAISIGFTYFSATAISGGAMSKAQILALALTPVLTMVSGAIYTAVGGDHLNGMVSSVTGGWSVQFLESIARRNAKGSNGESQTTIDPVDPVADIEAKLSEANAQARGSRFLGGVRRVTETLTYFPPFNSGMKQALRNQDIKLQRMGHRIAATAFLHVIKTRLETTKDTRMVMDMFSGAVYSKYKGRPEDFISWINRHRELFADAVRKVHKEIYKRELTDEEFTRDVNPFLEKIFAPDYQRDLVNDLSEVDEADSMAETGTFEHIIRLDQYRNTAGAVRAHR